MEAKFQVQDILPLALVIVVAGIGIAYGLSTLGDIRDDMVTNVANCGLNSTGGTTSPTYTACGADYNATVDTVTAVSKFSSKLGLIVTVVVAAILIGILVRYLARPGGD